MVDRVRILVFGAADCKASTRLKDRMSAVLSSEFWDYHDVTTEDGAKIALEYTVDGLPAILIVSEGTEGKEITFRRTRVDYSKSDLRTIVSMVSLAKRPRIPRCENCVLVQRPAACSTRKRWGSLDLDHGG